MANTLPPTPPIIPPSAPAVNRYDGVKSQAEISAEKAAKPRVDLIPGSSLLATGAVQAYGRFKHGQCTWRDITSEQSHVDVHVASAMRHLSEYLYDTEAVEQGSNLPVLWHAMAQLAIAIDCECQRNRAKFQAHLNSLPATLEALRKENR